MKQFFLRISIFLLIVLVGAWAIDFVISYRLRHNENRMFAAWNQIYKDSLNYDFLVSGGSCAWAHYSTQVIDSTLGVNSFNLGIDGSSINRQILKYEKFCSIHGKPNMLIQNIDLGTLDFTHGYEREQFFPYFFYDRDLMQKFDLYENFTFAEKYLPCYRYLGYDEVWLEALFEDNQQHYFEFLTKGYGGRDYVWDGTTLSSIDSLSFEYDTAAVRLLSDFLKTEIAAGVEVVLVFSPIYYGVQEKLMNLEEMYMLYDSIAEAYNIPILNYHTIEFKDDTTYFYNGTHLNRTGAELFTTKLAHDIDSLGLLK
ncbi:MAG: hypothetical protein J6S09_02200 [Paludibacteraceae bacterium]|nr:hypothetical protein [Paludibacteraceae bacterium]